METTEIRLNWSDLDDLQSSLVIEAHCISLKCDDREHMLRLFNLGQPDIIFAKDYSYCRCAAESVGVMKVIIRNYL